MSNFNKAVNTSVEKFIFPFVVEYMNEKGVTVQVSDLIVRWNEHCGNTTKKKGKIGPALKETCEKGFCSKYYKKGARGNGYCPNPVEGNAEFCTKCNKSLVSRNSRKKSLVVDLGVKEQEIKGEIYNNDPNRILYEKKYILDKVKNGNTFSVVGSKVLVDGQEKELEFDDKEYLKSNGITVDTDFKFKQENVQQQPAPVVVETKESKPKKESRKKLAPTDPAKKKTSAKDKEKEEVRNVPLLPTGLVNLKMGNDEKQKLSKIIENEEKKHSVGKKPQTSSLLNRIEQSQKFDDTDDSDDEDKSNDDSDEIEYN